MAAHFRWKYFLVSESARQKIRIASQMFFEEIDAAAMQRHGWCIRQFDAMLHIHFENRMFFRRFTTIGFEYNINGCDALAIYFAQLHAQLKQYRRAGRSERVGGSVEQACGWRRSAH